MGFLDKVLNLMKINDDYEDDEFMSDEMDDYEDDYLSARESRNSRTYSKHNDESPDSYYGDDDEDEIYTRRKTSTASRSFGSKNAGSGSSPFRSTSRTRSGGSVSSQSSGSKVSSFRPKRSSLQDMSVCVVKPKNMEDAREITETLLDNCTVVLNMENIDFDLAQRIIDFTSGSCYAINGNLQKISNYIFIITPESVDVSGDLQDLLGGAFDIPSMTGRF